MARADPRVGGRAMPIRQMFKQEANLVAIIYLVIVPVVIIVLAFGVAFNYTGRKDESRHSRLLICQVINNTRAELGLAQVDCETLVEAAMTAACSFTHGPLYWLVAAALVLLVVVLIRKI